MVSDDQVGAGIDRGVCNGRLIGADRLGDEAQSPVDRHQHDVGFALGLV